MSSGDLPVMPSAESDEDLVRRHAGALLAALDAALAKTDPLTPEEKDTLRSQHAMFMMVLDVDTQMRRRQTDARQGVWEGLDLDAARAEIHRRLARYKAAMAR